MPLALTDRKNAYTWQKPYQMSKELPAKRKETKNYAYRHGLIKEEFEKHNVREVPIAVIYRKYIYPKFGISLRHLHNILSGKK